MTKEIKTRIKQIQNSQVPNGYKKTNLGTVPNEWGQCLLSDLVTLKNGINADISKFGKGVKLISVSDILSPKPVMYDSINASIDISEELLDTYSVDYGDIIFQRSSENYEDAGTSNVYLDTKRATFGGFVIRGKKKADYNPQFLSLFLKSFGARKNIIRLAAGSQHVNISQDSLSKLQLHLPSLPEQEKIADILTTQDTIIELKEKRIAEKEKQKKYLMQNLLTGKKRLAGFSGEWKKVKLGEVVKVVGGYAFNSSKFLEKGIPIVRISNIENNIINLHDCVKYEEIALNSNFKAKKGDLFIAMSGATTGKIGEYLYTYTSYVNQRVGKFVLIDKNYSYALIKQILISSLFSSRLAELLVAGAQPNIASKDIENLTFYFSNSLPEQNAIAEILSTVDKEIELLKKDLDAEKEKKKSLMQILLTGIVRV